VNDYFIAATAQLQERANHLIGIIPRDLGRDVDTLVVICRDRLNRINQRLDRINRMGSLTAPRDQLLAVRNLRRAVDELDLLEAVPIAALTRWNDDDRRMNRTTDRIAREIKYPLPTPVVTCSSQTYYHTYTRLGLILVPLAESRFLLHLPDLYHELGHPLLDTGNDPKIKPFQSKCSEALASANDYLAGELEAGSTGLGPDAFPAYISTWLRCWEAWIVELFCDLFALYVLGPAFAWSHLHLTVLRGDEQPFRVPTLLATDHPPDAARMSALLEGLNLVGEQTVAGAIGQRWQQILMVLNASPSPEFRRCFPDWLIRGIANAALKGTRDVQCNMAFPTPTGEIQNVLNEAWQRFWNSPATYVQWERQAAKTIFN
jgi:hypothetical protein